MVDFKDPNSTTYAHDAGVIQFIYDVTLLYNPSLYNDYGQALFRQFRLYGNSGPLVHCL